LSSITGVYRIPGLPLLSTSISGKANEAIVFRTWGLLKQEPALQKEFYGPNFTYREFMYAPGPIRGMLMHYLIVMGGYLMLLGPFRAFIRLLVFEPGDGPDTEKAKEDVIELQATGKPDSESEVNKQVFGKLSYIGSMYYRKLLLVFLFQCLISLCLVTAALLAEAAITMLQEDNSTRLTGGVYTPACLGQAYINRLQEVGFKFDLEIRDVDD
jgi:hypothetical protein